MATRHIQQRLRAPRIPKWRLPPTLATHTAGGVNLEIFKFGMYIFFPIGWMYYFGVNLETRFAVPDFWPAPGTTHRLPFEREELDKLAEQLKAERLEKRRRRLERERREGMGEGGSGGEQVAVGEQRTLVAKAERLEKRRRRLEREKGSGMGKGESGGERKQGGEQRTLVAESKGTFGVGSIESWARGKWRD